MKAVITVGRMNPPTSGHDLLINKIKSEAKKQGAKPILFLTQTHDKKRNPMSPSDKVTYAKKFFSGITVQSIKTPIEALAWCSKHGITEVTIIVGSDRVDAFKKFANYNGKDFNLEAYNVMSAGQRDPDAEDVSGMSASKMRGFVKAGDYVSFRKGLPAGAKEFDAQKLYKLLGDVLNEDLDEVLENFLGEQHG